MPFSTDDQALLRGQSHTIRATLNATPLVTVATAQINQATFAYPIARLTVDNTSADWLTKVKAGMGFSIGTSPGGSDVTWGVVRATPTASLFYLDAKSLGDPGYARNIHAPLTDNYYITVYKHRPPWGLLSSIRSGVFYKAYEIPFTGQTISPDPIISIGKHRAAFVDNAGFASFAFSASAYTWNKAVSSYLWDVDGGTLLSGTLTSSNITVQFPAGFYVVTCTITDSAGKSRLSYRYVWANSTDRTNLYSPFNYRHRVENGNDRQDANGRELSIDVFGDLEVGDIYPGQAFLLTTEDHFDGVLLSDTSAFVNNFIGYVPSKSIDLTRKVKKTSVQIESPITAAKGVPSAVQLLTEVAAPANWTECTSLLSNPVGAAHYCMVHHAPFLLDAHDLEFDSYLLYLRFKGHEFQSRDIQSQLQSVAERFLGNIGCRSDGTIRMVRNPMYLTNAFRLAQSVQWDWNTGDFTNAYQQDVLWRMKVGSVYGYAFSHNGAAESTPYASLAPGRSQAQGSGQDQMTAFIVITADGQTEVNRITGHHFAMVNNPSSNYSLDVDRNLDVAEPCDMDRWQTLTISGRYDPEGVGIAAQRAIPTQVTRRWSTERSTRKTISIDFLTETFGQPGVTMPVNRGGANTWVLTEWNPADLDPFTPPMPDLNLSLPIFLAGNSNGAMGRSTTMDEPAVAWERQ